MEKCHLILKNMKNKTYSLHMLLFIRLYSLPKILQTDKHHWLILNNSMMKVIPIKNIIPVS